MIEMQKKPEIWDDSPFHTTCDELLGVLAQWAVQQSPYLCPDNLQQALEEFDLANPYNRTSFPECIFETSCKGLIPFVRGLFEACPTILAWNNPKIGRHTVAFVSRCSQPKPDYDFIDLDALARNIAHSVTVLNKYDQSQEAIWEAEREAEIAKERADLASSRLVFGNDAADSEPWVDEWEDENGEV